MLTTVASTARSPRVHQAWQVLNQVLDPEVPAVSVVELGIVRDVIEQHGMLEVVLTPTYSGCPATEVIEADVRAALETAGLGPVRTSLQRAPAWTTDWISESGREKLRAYGIAPPGPVDATQGVPIKLMSRRELGLSTPARGVAASSVEAASRSLRRSVDASPVACPRCASLRTERLSAFGATACKSLYRCLECGEPFEHFKPI